MLVQMPLKMGLRDEATFKSYVAEDESVAYALFSLQTNIKQPKGNAFYLYGARHVGKTHLLQAACRHATELGLSSVYLPMADLSLPLIPDVLTGLEHTHVVCLDDIGQVVGQPAWEQALNNLIIRGSTQGNTLIIAGDLPMEQWALVEKELTKALMTIVPVPLLPLTQKEELISALQRHSQCLGFELPENVGDYLIKHHAQTLPELMQILRLLEEATLVQKRKLTLQFVRSILQVKEKLK